MRRVPHRGRQERRRVLPCALRRLVPGRRPARIRPRRHAKYREHGTDVDLRVHPHQRCRRPRAGATSKVGRDPPPEGFHRARRSERGVRHRHRCPSCTLERFDVASSLLRSRCPRVSGLHTRLAKIPAVTSAMVFCGWLAAKITARFPLGMAEQRRSLGPGRIEHCDHVLETLLERGQLVDREAVGEGRYLACQTGSAARMTPAAPGTGPAAAPPMPTRHWRRIQEPTAGRKGRVPRPGRRCCTNRTSRSASGERRSECAEAAWRSQATMTRQAAAIRVSGLQAQYRLTAHADPDGSV